MSAPAYEFLSAPAWLVTALHLVTLTLHLTAMGYLFGGLGSALLAPRGADGPHPATRAFLRSLPSAMAATITLGVAPLLFLQLVYYRQAYAAAIASAWYWLGILLAAGVAYALLYRVALARGPWGRGTTALLAVAFAGLLYVSLTYSAIFALAESPETIARLHAADPSGGSFHPDLGAWAVRWLHMLTGALAIGAFFFGLFAREDEALFRHARRAFAAWMVVAMTFGLVYLSLLGPDLMPFMRTAGPVLVTVGFLLSLGALHLFFARRFALAGGLLVASVFTMVASRHLLRHVRLEGVAEAAAMPFRPQWSVLVLFLVCFVLALGVLGYMARLFLGGREPADGR